MPDLITHVLAITPFKRSIRKNFSLILLGVLLPDIAGRTLGTIFPNSHFFNWAELALHTPISLLLVIYLLSMFFPENQRKSVFTSFTLGASFHFALDIFQKNATYNTPWLFHFSFSSFRISVLWSDESIYLIPFLVVLNLVIYRREIFSRSALRKE